MLHHPSRYMSMMSLYIYVTVYKQVHQPIRMYQLCLWLISNVFVLYIEGEGNSPNYW